MRFWSKHLAILQYKLRHATPFIKPGCRKILCYGDSNTWGYRPGRGSRLGAALRWPGVLQYCLGRRAIVYEEGFSGRTTMWDDPQAPGRNGRRKLMTILRHYAPLDGVVIMLGTNDLKSRFDLSAHAIAGSAGILCKDILNSKSGRDGGAPEILLVAPPPIPRLTSARRAEFDGAIEKSKMLATHYSDIAATFSIQFLDAAKFISASQADPIHWDSSAHQTFGRIVAERFRH